MTIDTTMALWFLLDVSIRACVAAVAAVVVLRVFTVRAAALRHTVWTTVLVAMLLMPILPSIVPAVPMPALPRLAPAADRTDPRMPGITPPQLSPQPASATPTMIGGSSPETESATFIPQPTRGPAARPWWAVVLVSVYAFGVVVFVSRLGRGWLLVAGLLRRARSGGRLTIGSARDAVVYQSNEVAAPLTAGAVRPAVILPARWREWTPDALAAVVAHELAHVRRRDALVLLLARVNRAVFWFHPLAWWLERQLAVTAEHACDEIASVAVPEPRRYAEILVEMADAVRRHSGRVAWQAVGVDGAGTLEARIDRVLRGGFARTSRTRAAATMLMCAAAIVLIAACRTQVGATPLREDPDVARSIALQQTRNELGRAALDLSKEQAAALEESLLRNPTDLDTRYKLLEFYQASGKVTMEERTLAVRRHALWLIDAQIPAGSTITVPQINPTRDPEGAQLARDAWTRRLAKPDVSVTDIARAAVFFSSYDKAHAEELLLRGRQLDPEGHALNAGRHPNEHYSWSSRLGHLYARAIVGASDVGASTTDPKEAAGPFAARARQALDASQDAVMLASAGAYLTGPGRRAKLPFDQVELGRSYLERAVQIDPQNLNARGTLARLASNQRESQIEAALRKARGGARDLFDQFSDEEYAAVTALPQADRLFYLPLAAEHAYLRAENIEWVGRDKPEKEKAERQVKAQAGFDRSRQYAEDAIGLAEKRADLPESNDAIYRSKVTLALLALKSGDRARAVELMKEAGAVPGSQAIDPTEWGGLRSRLVEYLLREGERESVAAFLERSAALSPANRTRLLADAARIRSGVMPLSYQYAESRRQ